MPSKSDKYAAVEKKVLCRRSSTIEQIQEELQKVFFEGELTGDDGKGFYFLTPYEFMKCPGPGSIKAGKAVFDLDDILKLSLGKSESKKKQTNPKFTVGLKSGKDLTFEASSGEDAVGWCMAIESACSTDDAIEWAAGPKTGSRDLCPTAFQRLDIDQKGETPVVKQMRDTLSAGGVVIVRYVDPEAGHKKKKSKPKKGKALMLDLLHWVENQLGETFPTEDFAEALYDGQALCHLMNKLKKRSIRRKHINKSKSKFKVLENLAHFIEAAKKFGVEPAALFSATDMAEKKNLRQTVICLDTLRRINNAKMADVAPPAPPKEAAKPKSAPSAAAAAAGKPQPYFEFATMKPGRNSDMVYCCGKHTGLKGEFDHWKAKAKMLGTKEQLKKQTQMWLERRKEQYVACLKAVADVDNNRAIFGVLRIQDEPTEPVSMSPAKFGDLVCVWNPHMGLGTYEHMMDDAVLMQKSTISKLCGFLTSEEGRSKLLSSNWLTRQGGCAHQGKGDGLDYITVYHTIFRRSMTGFGGLVEKHL